MAIRSEIHDDPSLFKNRLWTLMRGKDVNLDTPRKLATLLYNEGYVLAKKRNNDSFNEHFKDKSNTIGSMEKKIRIQLNSDSADCMEGEYVIAYCNIFCCSADYLFGYTDIKTCDIEIRRICEITGLSEDAIIAIRRITDPTGAFSAVKMQTQESQALLNRLLKAQRFLDFIRGLKDLDDAYLVPTLEKKVWDKLSSQLGKVLFEEALEWHDKLDALYKSPKPRPELCEAVKMVEDTMDTAFGLQQKFEYDVKISRYELHEIYTALIDELYPRSL